MTQYLLLDPEKAAAVFGYRALEAWLVSSFGEQTIQGISSHIYGIYTGLVYFTPLFGGIIADKFLGQYRTVYLGGILMAIGHFLMASEELFFVALIFIILGNGAFKPNISTQVGVLYKQDDPRRDAAYSIFYMGINLGAFLAPLVCGTLGQTIGWHYGFGAAGVGMLLGLIVYYLGSDLVPKVAVSTSQKSTEKRTLTSQEWKAVWALGLLCLLNITFWAIYEQQGNVLQLWADEKTNWDVMGLFTVPSTWYQAFNPAFIFLFTPLIIKLWAWQNKRGKEPSSVEKMGIGCFLCGSAYIFMIMAAKFVPGTEKGSVIWLTLTTLMFTLGELYLSPIGLSLVTKVSPAPIVSMMMGMWFLSSFFGNYLTGFIGSFYSKMSHDSFFTMLTAIGVITGLVFYILRKPISSAIGKNV
jgi:POT family proton-dependent oligopeptide transporter